MHKKLAGHIVIINHGVKVFDDTLQNLQQNIGDEQIVETVVRELPMEQIITRIYTMAAE